MDKHRHWFRFNLAALLAVVAGAAVGLSIAKLGIRAWQSGLLNLQKNGARVATHRTRSISAEQQIVALEAAYVSKKIPLDLMLDGKRRLMDAKSEYHRARVDDIRGKVAVALCGPALLLQALLMIIGQREARYALFGTSATIYGLYAYFLSARQKWSTLIGLLVVHAACALTFVALISFL